MRSFESIHSRITYFVDSRAHPPARKITESKVAHRALHDISSYLVELTCPSTLTTLSIQCHASIGGPPTHKGLLKQTVDLGRSISASLIRYHRLEEMSLAVRFHVSFGELDLMEGSYSDFDIPRTTQTHSHQETSKGIDLIVCMDEMSLTWEEVCQKLRSRVLSIPASLYPIFNIL